MNAFAPCERVVIGSRNDQHVDQVVRRLTARATVVVDAETLPDVLIHIDEEQTVAKDLTGLPVSIGATAGVRGWIRRLSPPSWDHGAVIGSRRAAELAAQLACLGLILRDPMIDWLTPVDAQLSSENKMVQARAARAAKIASPRAIVGGCAEFLESRLGPVVVVKPLGPGNYEEDGRQHVVYTQAVATNSLTRLGTLDPPFVTQKLIQADRHLRIVTLADRTWGAALPAEGLPVDWRRSDAAHSSFVAHELTAAEVDGAQRIAQQLGVRYSAQDWLCTADGEATFIDLNPAGQWLFLPAEIAEQITDEIANWLEAS